jgi:hypothetical protein
MTFLKFNDVFNWFFLSGVGLIITSVVTGKERSGSLLVHFA